MGQHSSRPTFQDIYDEKRRDRFRRHRPSRLNLRESAVGSPLSVPQPTDSRPPSLKSVRSKKITGILRRVRSSADVRHRPFNGTTLHEVVPVPPLPFVLQRHLPSPAPFPEHALPPYAQDVSQPGFTVLSSCSQTVCPAVTPQLKPFNTCSPTKPAVPEAANAEASFRAAYPEYASTLPLDFLRNAEYSRLRPGEVYVDSMGGALYPELLIRAHADFLEKAVLGNTHSQSSSSQLSTSHAAAAREAVLSHFNAPVGSKVIFTANASQALKLVGESFPFGPGSTYLLPEDAHNSVHGIREFARRGGAEVVYMPGRLGRGGIDVTRARVLLDANAPLRGDAALAAFTGLSNLTNTKMSLGPIASSNSPSHEHKRSTSNVSLPTPPSSATAASFSFLYLHPSQEPAPPTKDVPTSYHPSLLAHAKGLGYTTLLDAAALAPTSTLDLSATPIDAVAISFYKMFGYPTGVGALILAPGVGEFLLQPGRSGAGGRPWFAGGTVDVVQVPGNVISRTKIVEEAFEDGTLNYLQLPAIPVGLTLLRSYLPFLPTRLAALAHFLATELSLIKHANGALGVRVLSRVPGRISSVGGVERHRRLPPVPNTGHVEMAHVPSSAWEADEDRDGEETGGTVSFVVLDSNGDQVPLSTIGASAAASDIMLRTGCMCNPGGAAAVLRIAPFMAQLRAGATLHALEEAAGHELGVVRVSFGLVSSWEDAWAVVCWARKGVAENWVGFREAAAPGWQPAVAL